MPEYDKSNFPVGIYKLKNSIQKYAWGTKGKNAFIAKFIQKENKKAIPMAELWIGTHSKLPSQILLENNYYNLDEIIKKFPQEILGKKVAQKFNNKLPFLLKILSIEKPLSIQAHPNKKLAKILHKNNPKNYSDSNHKPEIAIALDKFELLIGFKSFKEIYSTINKYQALKNNLSFNFTKKMLDKSEVAKRKIIKKIYSEWMNYTPEKLKEIIQELVTEINKKGKTNNTEKLFLKLQKQYGSDIGLLSLLILNHLTLKKDEAIFTKAGIPHAYLKGNIIECMANSDNVIRAGFTNKYKDKNTLLKMLTYENGSVKIIKNKNKKMFIYSVSAEEFEVVKFNIKNKSELYESNVTGVRILLVLKGTIKIISEKYSEKFLLKRGGSVLIPAILKSYKIICNKNTEFICVKVPIN